MKARAAQGLEPLFDGVHRDLFGGPGRCRIEWYAYVSTKSTIRDRDGVVHVRISDHLEDAPDDALRGLLGVLLCRLRRVPEARVDATDRQAYERWIHEERVATRRSSSRRDRGRKHIDPVGEHRSLLESYLRVTMDMGLHMTQAPKLSWSRDRTRRRFGHQDADHGAIVISRTLDDPEVPEFVLDYVVYHELLHIVIPPRIGPSGRRIVHCAAFKRAEARFPQQAEAERWLGRLARR